LGFKKEEVFSVWSKTRNFCWMELFSEKNWGCKSHEAVSLNMCGYFWRNWNGKGINHRGRTYIESEMMTSSAPMKSADQPMQSDQLTPLAPMTSSCRSLYMSFLFGINVENYAIADGWSTSPSPRLATRWPSSSHFRYICTLGKILTAKISQINMWLIERARLRNRQYMCVCVSCVISCQNILIYSLPFKNCLPIWFPQFDVKMATLLSKYLKDELRLFEKNR